MKRKLVSGDEAVECPKQPQKACSDCPWGREALNGWLGHLSIDEWIQSAHGETTVECHAQKGPNGPWACAGLALYRANVGKIPRNPNALRLPADRESVFANPMQFREHHEKRDPR